MAACNAIVDGVPASLERSQWWGHIQREDHPEHRGRSYQQIYESGAAFEKLIDHPSWINYVLRFVGGQDTFDYHHGPLFIDENFVTCRGPGDAIPIHGGGHDHCKKMSYGYANGRFYCGQINVLIALTKTGPGDGETMLIPGSHKSNIVHPALLEQGQGRWVTGGSLDDTLRGDICVHGCGRCNCICRLLLPRLRQADNGGRTALYRFPVRLELEPNSLGLHAFGPTAAPAEPIRGGHHPDNRRDRPSPAPIGPST